MHGDDPLISGPGLAVAHIHDGEYPLVLGPDWAGANIHHGDDPFVLGPDRAGSHVHDGADHVLHLPLAHQVLQADFNSLPYHGKIVQDFYLREDQTKIIVFLGPVRLEGRGLGP